MGRARFRFRLLWFVFQSGGGEDLGQLSAAIAPIALIFLKIEARPLTAASIATAWCLELTIVWNSVIEVCRLSPR